jgi:beta-lactamase class A
MICPRCLFPVFAASLIVSLAAPAFGQNALRGSFADPSPRLQSILDKAVASALEQFTDKDLKPGQFAVTLVDLQDPAKPLHASYRGDQQIYPASVIKLFYLVAAHRWMEDGKLADTPELRRAMSDMIVHSYNEATGYVVDVLTGTTSGPELSADEIKVWFDKRNAVNRYFASLGYTGINANKKPWCEGPYGRETQAIKAFEPKRNMLTTDATARLMTEIATGKAITAKRCDEMLALMKRDPFSTSDKNTDSQAKFTGPVLPRGSKLWSKAGWTSQTRHDAALVELPDGHKFILVTFTVDHANERGIIPAVAKVVIEELAASK